jgi:hypothetical protein
MEDGGIVGQVDVLDEDLARLLVHHARFLFGAVGLDDEGCVGLCRVHLDLLAPVVLEAVQHLALVQAGSIAEELLLVVGYLLEHANFILPHDLLERVHVKVVQVPEVKVQSCGVLNGFDQVVRLQVLMKHQVVAQLRNLCGNSRT